MSLPGFGGIGVLVGLGMAGVALAVAGCERSSAAGDAPPPPPAAVTVARPVVRDVMEWDEYTGVLQPVSRVEVRPRVGGFIDSVSFTEGGLVKEGDVLFVIDARPYQAELDRARGEAARAKAQLALAETQFKRTTQLVPTKAASELELDERRADRDAARAVLDIANAAVTAAELNVQYTKVVAPIAGRVSNIRVTRGNLVTGGGGGAAGQGGGGDADPLTTIESMDPMYCYVDADERSVLRYQRLARQNKRVSARDAKIRARLRMEDEENFVHEGVVDFVDNRVDRTTGTLQARGVFPNKDASLTSGMFARMRIPGAEPYRATLVAEAALQADQSKKYVLTLDDADVVHITPVTVGSAFGNMRAIESGLTGGERIIVNGMLRARPGSPVKPTEGPMPGEQDLAWFAPDGKPPTTNPATTAPATTAPATRPTTEPVADAVSRGQSTTSVNTNAFVPLRATVDARVLDGGADRKVAGASPVRAKPRAAVARTRSDLVARSQHEVRNPQSEVRNPKVADALIPFGVPVASTDEGGAAE